MDKGSRQYSCCIWQALVQLFGLIQFSPVESKAINRSDPYRISYAILARVRGKQQPQEFSPDLPQSLLSLKHELMFLEYDLVPGYKHFSNSSPVTLFTGQDGILFINILKQLEPGD